MKKALLTSVKEERQSLLLLLGLICGEIGEYIGGYGASDRYLICAVLP